MIRLIGPGGAGKTSTGALLAERLAVPFIDLDRYLTDRVGDISKYIDRHGYEAYARVKVATYCSACHNQDNPGVVALSSGFMTYACDVHREYLRVRSEIEQSPTTFVLLPSLDFELCVAETVRRQVGRPFGRSPAKEEAVIRARYPIYLAIPARKVQTMRAISEVADEIIAALPSNERTAAHVSPHSRWTLVLGSAAKPTEMGPMNSLSLHAQSEVSDGSASRQTHQPDGQGRDHRAPEGRS